MKIKILCAMLLCLILQPMAHAGYISTEVRDSRSRTWGHVFVSCNGAGEDLMGSSTDTRSSDDLTGAVSLSNISASTYTVGASEKECYETIYRKGIVVPASGYVPFFTLQFAPASYATGTDFFRSWGNTYAQSFKATGNNLISIGLRCQGAQTSSGGATDISVAILDGEGPDAPQIGPTRKLVPNAMNAQAAYWSAGEVQTIPGHIYTVKLFIAGGGSMSPFYQTVRNRMRYDNPDGKTWMNGQLINSPIEMTVNQDDAGMINTMCCARNGINLSINSIFGIGQTFTSKGTSVVMVTWLAGDTSLWRITVYNWNKDTNTIGSKVGVSKYVHAVAWDGRSVATWAPGEVPTVAGNMYYVEFKPGTSTCIYNDWGVDSYSGGQCWSGGIQQTCDLAVGIYEEKSSGIFDVPKLIISSFKADNITATSANIKWSVNSAADGYVEWGEVAPYTSSKYSSTLTKTQVINITGLKPNTMYHMRSTSKASGYKDAVYKDTVFVTAPATTNLLADPGFESGSFGTWTRFGSGDIRIITAPWLWGANSHSGVAAVAGAGQGTTYNGGAYQRIPAIPGAEYKLSAWLWTYSAGANMSSWDQQTVGKIGIDPTGGTNPDGLYVKWSPITNTYFTAYLNATTAYTPIWMSASAIGSHITVFLNGSLTSPNAGSCATLDDAVLTTDTVPTDTDLLTAMKDTADGTLIKFGSVTCTATTSQAGAYYVENSDRYKGIRVETTESMSVGNLVTITGKILTKPSGERYIEAYILSPTTGTAIEPLLISCKNLGGSAFGNCQAVGSGSGPYNVGLLVRIAGSVKAIVGNTIWVNDGSIEGNGIKVQVSSLPTGTVVGSNVGISGILQLEGTAPSATPLIRATEVNLF